MTVSFLRERTGPVRFYTIVQKAMPTPTPVLKINVPGLRGQVNIVFWRPKEWLSQG